MEENLNETTDMVQLAKDLEAKLSKSENIKEDLLYALDNYDVNEPTMKEVLLKYKDDLISIKEDNNSASEEA